MKLIFTGRRVITLSGRVAAPAGPAPLAAARGPPAGAARSSQPAGWWSPGHPDAGRHPDQVVGAEVEGFRVRGHRQDPAAAQFDPQLRRAGEGFAAVGAGLVLAARSARRRSPSRWSPDRQDAAATPIRVRSGRSGQEEDDGYSDREDDDRPAEDLAGQPAPR